MISAHMFGGPSDGEVIKLELSGSIVLLDNRGERFLYRIEPVESTYVGYSSFSHELLKFSVKETIMPQFYFLEAVAAATNKVVQALAQENMREIVPGTLRIYTEDDNIVGSCYRVIERKWRLK